MWPTVAKCVLTSRSWWREVTDVRRGCFQFVLCFETIYNSQIVTSAWRPWIKNVCQGSLSAHVPTDDAHNKADGEMRGEYRQEPGRRVQGRRDVQLLQQVVHRLQAVMQQARQLVEAHLAHTNKENTVLLIIPCRQISVLSLVFSFVFFSYMYVSFPIPSRHNGSTYKFT